MSNYDLSLLTIEDFPEGFRDIVEIIGIEAAYKLCDYCGGNPIYIPKSNLVNTRLRNLNIQNDYKAGTPIPELVKKYNLNFSQIRSICQMAYMRQPSVEEFLNKY